MLCHRLVAAVARTITGNISCLPHITDWHMLYPYGDSLALGFSNLDQHWMLNQLQRQPNKVLVDSKMSLLLNNNLKLMTRLNEIFLMNKLCKC